MKMWKLDNWRFTIAARAHNITLDAGEVAIVGANGVPTCVP
jgi:hypothetical protein